MIGYHDIRFSGSPSCTVYKTLVRKIRTLVAQALARSRRKELTGHIAPPDTKRIQITINRLARKRIRDGKRSEHVSRNGSLRSTLMLIQAKRQLFLHCPVHPVKTRIVFVALKTTKRYASGNHPIKDRQLMRNKLIGEGICLGSNTNGNVVCFCKQNLRQQIRNRLAHTGARLNCSM